MDSLSSELLTLIIPFYIIQNVFDNFFMNYNMNFLKLGSLLISNVWRREYWVRDWSLITGRGGLQNGKIAGPQLFATPPHDRVKLFAPPLLKSGNFSRLPYNMASTSSYLLKTTPKLFVPPPSACLKLFPPPLFVGVKLHSPPPPVL